MPKELTNSEYLHDLTERLMHVPVMYGTDQGDVGTLHRIANELTKHDNGAPMFNADGMMLDDKGNRSIFDDVDE